MPGDRPTARAGDENGYNTSHHFDFDFNRRITQLGIQPQLGLWSIRRSWARRNNSHYTGPDGQNLAYAPENVMAAEAGDMDNGAVCLNVLVLISHSYQPV